MRPATDLDGPALLAFLHGHEATSMFAMTNLLGQGVAMRVWVADAVKGMVGLTEDGMVLPQCPGGDPAAMARALAGAAVTGLLGPAEQVKLLRVAMGFGGAAVRHAGEEPGYRLRLEALRLPDCDGWQVRPVAGAVVETVRRWRAAYETELFAMSAPEAAEKAASDVERWQRADSHRVLWHRGTPVALTGFNAALPEVVQIGAVYVPPELRGQGHARRAVGLHLVEARDRGVRRAVLFAASEAAERAYRALGFQAAGRMGLVLFVTPQVVT